MARRFTDGHFDWTWQYYGRYDDRDMNMMTAYMRSEFKISQIIKAYIEFILENNFGMDNTATY